MYGTTHIGTMETLFQFCDRCNDAMVGPLHGPALCRKCIVAVVIDNTKHPWGNPTLSAQTR